MTEETGPREHCPVFDFDHQDARRTHDEIWDAYRRMHAAGRVSYSPHHGGFTILSCFDDVMAAGRDHSTFSSASGHYIPMVGDNRNIPIDFDPPLHTDRRELVTRAITGRIALDKAPATRAFLAERLEALVARGGGEMVEEIALPLPLWMLSQIVGLSADTTAKLRPLTEQSWKRISTESIQSARAAEYALMAEELDDDRHQDDYIGWLRNEATVDGRPITRDEAVNVLVGLAIAGHETTLNSVGNLLYQLAIDPALQRRLRDEPGIISRVVEESLRHRTPAQLFGRVTTQQTDIGGVTIDAGEQVMLAYAAANRDPGRFTDPETFNPDRERPQHLAFGWGIHQCVGAPLARMEMRVLLELVRELPFFELDGDVEWSQLEGGHHLGVRRLPVRFIPPDTAGALRVEVDADVCCGYGNCVLHADDVFELDDESGVSRVRTASVAADREAAVRAAAADCPTRAITVVELARR